MKRIVKAEGDGMIREEIVIEEVYNGLVIYWNGEEWDRVKTDDEFIDAMESLIYEMVEEWNGKNDDYDDFVIKGKPMEVDENGD